MPDNNKKEFFNEWQSVAGDYSWEFQVNTNRKKS